MRTICRPTGRLCHCHNRKWRMAIMTRAYRAGAMGATKSGKNTTGNATPTRERAERNNSKRVLLGLVKLLKNLQRLASSRATAGVNR